MRVRSDIFVSALVRRAFAAGGFAVVEHRGADDGGAIAIRQVCRNGEETLYLPALQGFAAEDNGDRIFEARLKAASADKVSDMLEKEMRFDSDLWVVVLESDDIDGFFTVASGE